ncbi:RRQRL motif-containing zinc-binding protein [Saccharopolyspora gregorii]|uniref:RRQRL motif-containing zinc-binding protein n=1 Tax=Saccharopolyspora gregorii TaxID=33914 RepID=UPI0021AC017A|nr:RRQRL motif-containing zinc-binding protein [Saccharopolyspora gregorii]
MSERRYRTSLDCYDPNADRHPLPTYPWGEAPEHLFTRRQLREAGLCPGRQPAVAQMLRPRQRRPTDPLRAWLYDGHHATEKRTPTLAQHRAIRAMNRAHRICDTCDRDVGYRIPKTPPLHGECLDCHDTRTQPAAA